MGDIADVYDGIHQTPDYTDNGIMFLSVENINTLKSEKYISEEAFIRDYKVYPEKGDILMTRIGDVGTPNVVETTEKVAFYVSLALLKPINVDSYFLCNSILSPFFQNGLKERTLVTAIPQKINKDEVGKVGLYLPTLIDEQREIGAFFQRLNNLITLHQRKYDKLQIIKKSMLEKMFPQNGSCFPEIRFKGFTDSWEQRKLGELAEIVGGGTPSTSVESYWDGDIDWYAPAEIGEQIYLKSSQRKITEEGLNKSSAKVLPVGTVLFTSRAGIGKTAILLKEGCTNQGFQSIVPNKDKLDSYFIFTRSEELKRYGETVGAGSTFVEVSGKQMANMELMMPTIMDEQQKIGEYFSNLDHLITLHQREFKYVYCRFIINKYKYISENYICIYTKIYGGLKMNNKLELYHGSGQIVEFPEIRKTRYTKDFSWGFYCTKSYEQAYRWAERKHENGIVNVYSYIENSELNIKKFDGMCEEWLDFIAECRAGKTHPYDIVEGPMADDTIWNFVNDYLNKNISKEVFWEYARFKHPSHQISFHSIRALECLKYERSIAVENDTVE